MDKWALFQGWWRTENDDSSVTDASSAEDSVIEDNIMRFQEVSKEITDRLAALSAARSSSDMTCQKLTEAATLALSYARDGKTNDVVRILQKALEQ